MTFKTIFFSRSYLERLPLEEREKIARSEAAAAKRMKERGDKVTEVEMIRRRRNANSEHAAA